MNNTNTAKAFALSFKQASGESAFVFSSALRFTAIMLVVIAVIWCINNFMSHAQQAGDDCLIQLGSRLIRLVLGLCLFILLLIVKEN